ncbi:MAG TPA: RNA polymerase sigma factor [Dehalococcoidia bacterium]
MADLRTESAWLARASVEEAFREHHGRLFATLVRSFRDFDLAEDALQDALTAALGDWPVNGIPDSPGAWLLTVARRKAIDSLRRGHGARPLDDAAAAAIEAAPELERAEDSVNGSRSDDDLLSLIFTCCHPSLGIEAQIGLTLRSVCGLSTTQIANAFLLPETTLAQRLVRAKRKIKDAGIPFRVPPPNLLHERVQAVAYVIYLVFNEGYASSSSEAFVDRLLCSEAIRLGRELAELLPDEPEVAGLLALMLLQDSRRRARIDSEGRQILLEGQDRTLWDRAQIDEASRLLEEALRKAKVGPYQIQAAIAGVHSHAAAAADTDWAEIVGLYDLLRRVSPSPVVELNRAVAVAMLAGPESGLRLMDQPSMAAALDSYRWYHSARADLLRRLDRRDEARVAYRRAQALSDNPQERAFLERRLRELDG